MGELRSTPPLGEPAPASDPAPQAVASESPSDDWIPVESSSVKAVKPLSAMRVHFKSGAVYEYGGVPRELCMRIAAAESVGRALNELVKGRYPHRRIEPDQGEGPT